MLMLKDLIKFEVIKLLRGSHHVTWLHKGSAWSISTMSLMFTMKLSLRSWRGRATVATTVSYLKLVGPILVLIRSLGMIKKQDQYWKRISDVYSRKRFERHSQVAAKNIEVSLLEDTKGLESVFKLLLWVLCNVA